MFSWSDVIFYTDYMILKFLKAVFHEFYVFVIY